MFGGLILCVLILIAATTLAAPIDDDSQAKIISYENHSDGTGNYDFSFETSNGILRRESGVIMNKGESDEYLYVKGEFTYTDPDGTLHFIMYQADKNGFEILPSTQVPQVSVTQVDFLPPNVVASMLG